MINHPSRFVNSWQQAGDTTPYQMHTAGYNSAAITAQSLYSSSDAVATDASYIRLKTAALS